MKMRVHRLSVWKALPAEVCRSIRWASAGVLFLVPLLSSAAESEISVEQVCAQVQELQFPPGDRPDAPALKSFGECDSEGLYYGIGAAADPVRARQCAFAELERGDDSVWSGASILMMIYANGTGTARNPDLAIKLACAIGGAPAELDGRVRHLLELKTGGPGKEQFDLCDDITSGYMMGACAAHQARIDKTQRSLHSDRLTGRWSESEKAAWQRLQQAASQYFEARVGNEVDASGTARAALMIGEETSLREDLLAALESFEKGALPHFSEQQFAAADARLNGVYKKVQGQRDFSWGTVTQVGIKATQRAWIRYRDAWVEFGGLKYPQVSAASWKAYLTEKRISQLEEFQGQ